MISCIIAITFIYFDDIQSNINSNTVILKKDSVSMNFEEKNYRDCFGPYRIMEKKSNNVKIYSNLMCLSINEGDLVNINEAINYISELKISEISKCFISAIIHAHQGQEKLSNNCVNSISSSQTKSDLCLRIGEVYENHQKMNEAISKYRESIKFNASNLNSYKRICMLHVKLNNIPEASLYLKSAFDVDSNDPDLYDLRGQVLLAELNPKAAINDFDKSIELGGKNSSVLSNRSLAYIALRDSKKSIADISEAINLDNEKNSILIKNRAVIYFMINDYAKAKIDYNVAASKELDKATSGQPVSFSVLSECALFLLDCPISELRDSKRAMIIAEQGCVISKWKNLACMEVLASAHFDNGNCEEAFKIQNMLVNIAEKSNNPKYQDYKKALNFYKDKLESLKSAKTHKLN